jgi:hypothetical protein
MLRLPNNNKFSRFSKEQNGQALTEFVIAASFVLVPLFLLISIAGKNADIKYASIQAARYEAWEYTANYYDSSQIEKGFTAVTKADLPVKTTQSVNQEARRRFFSDTRTALNSNSDKRGYDPKDANPLWRYHDGSLMINPTLSQNAPPTVLANENTPDIPKLPVFTTVLRVIDTVFEAFAKILSAVGVEAGFTAIDAKGLARSKVEISVANSPGYGVIKGARTSLMPDVKNLVMKAQSSVLTTNWSAGGTAHTKFQTRGLVPTVLLDELLSPGGFDVRKLLSWIPGLNEFDSDNLEFGKLLTDEKLHPSKIEGGPDDHSCDKSGECAY